MPEAGAPVTRVRRQAKMQRHHVADVCAKISAIKIVNRLNAFALGVEPPVTDVTLLTPEQAAAFEVLDDAWSAVHMSKEQIRASEILLSRIVPVLQSVAHTDPDGNALTVQCVQFSGAPIADRHAAK
jgi:hypothetical protein